MIYYFEPFKSSLSKLSLTSINIVFALTLINKLLNSFPNYLGQGIWK